LLNGKEAPLLSILQQVWGFTGVNRANRHLSTFNDGWHNLDEDALSRYGFR
jgi:hypothetical protein